MATSGAGSRQGEQMSRNFIILVGTLLWATFVVDALIHVAIGHWIAPAVAVLGGVAMTVFFRLRRARRRLAEAA